MGWIRWGWAPKPVKTGVAKEALDYLVNDVTTGNKYTYIKDNKYSVIASD
jgi:hypothetical protein